MALTPIKVEKSPIKCNLPPINPEISPINFADAFLKV